jgi:hypothetical protein
MNTQRFRSGWFRNCSLLMARFIRGWTSSMLDNKAEREWSELAWREAVAELRTRQSRHLPQRVANRKRVIR